MRYDDEVIMPVSQFVRQVYACALVATGVPVKKMYKIVDGGVPKEFAESVKSLLEIAYDQNKVKTKFKLIHCSKLVLEPEPPTGKKLEEKIERGIHNGIPTGHGT